MHCVLVLGVHSGNSDHPFILHHIWKGEQSLLCFPNKCNFFILPIFPGIFHLFSISFLVSSIYMVHQVAQSKELTKNWGHGLSVRCTLIHDRLGKQILNLLALDEILTLLEIFQKQPEITYIQHFTKQIKHVKFQSAFKFCLRMCQIHCKILSKTPANKSKPNFIICITWKVSKSQ